MAAAKVDPGVREEVFLDTYHSLASEHPPASRLGCEEL